MKNITGATVRSKSSIRPNLLAHETSESRTCMPCATSIPVVTICRNYLHQHPLDPDMAPNSSPHGVFWQKHPGALHQGKIAGACCRYRGRLRRLRLLRLLRLTQAGRRLPLGVRESSGRELLLGGRKRSATVFPLKGQNGCRARLLCLVDLGENLQHDRPRCSSG